MNEVTSRVIFFLIALIAFLIDQATKYWIATSMTINEQIPVIGNFFLITSHRNRGAAFGILQDQRWFFCRGNYGCTDRHYMVHA